MPFSLDLAPRVSLLINKHPHCSSILSSIVENPDYRLSAHEKQVLLGELSQLLIRPSLTLDISRIFRPILLDLIFRLIKNESSRVSSLEQREDIDQALSLLVQTAPHTIPFANPKKSFSSDNLVSVVAKYYVTKHCSPLDRLLQQLPESIDPSTLQTMCNSALTFLRCSRDLFSSMWSWVPLYDVLSASVNVEAKAYAVQCVILLQSMSEQVASNFASKFLPHNDRDRIDYVFRQAEGRALEQLVALTVPHLPVQDRSNLNFILSSDLCENLVDISGILVPTLSSQQNDASAPNRLVETTTAIANLQALAMALTLGKPVLLEGVTGAGKSSLVEEAAIRTGHTHITNKLVRIQMGDQTDSKSLLGSYVSTDIPGQFQYLPGVLVECVTKGRWVLIEDIDLAPMDVVSILVPVLENRRLFVPSRGEVHHASPGFQLFATQRLASAHAQKPQSESRLLQHLWTCVHVNPPSRDEILQIVTHQFPSLAQGTRPILAVYDNVSGPNDVMSQLTRPISIRDLFKWCHRIVSGSHQQNFSAILKEAFDCFCAFNAMTSTRWQLAESISRCLDISPELFSHFRDTDKPSTSQSEDFISFGRVTLRRRPKTIESIQKDGDTQSNNFAYSRQVLCLLEQLSVCVSLNEAVLLVGETGTGKTTAVGQLASLLRRNLIVVNMSQQSDSADLLGGFKPVELHTIVGPILDNFEQLFFKTFSRKQNAEFMNKTKLAFHKQKWPQLLKIFRNSLSKVQERLAQDREDAISGRSLSPEIKDGWISFESSLSKLQMHVEHASSTFAFSFVEGSLVKALRAGDWVLLDEINLASTETLECLNGLVDGSTGSVMLTERGDMQPVERHPDFRLFACMNPATDVGKKNLPSGLRNRFTELFVPESESREDLNVIAQQYLNKLSDVKISSSALVEFFLKAREQSVSNLRDGSNQKPHYSLRTLCRALMQAQSISSVYGAQRALYEGFCMSFLTQLDLKSHAVIYSMLKSVFSLKAVSFPVPPSPGKDFVNVCGFWLRTGALGAQEPSDYIMTSSIEENLLNVARIVVSHKYPVLLQGPTSCGKTSLIEYLAKRTGHKFVRINNHEHTDIQEYLGSYISDDSGNLVFREGALVRAVRDGHWIVLDELNLAPSDVLEALNRLLDDNRELFIPETQTVVKPHPNFMLFATQNPPGSYGGRKVLSRAFRNRFVELHFEDIPVPELEIILKERCQVPASLSKRLIAVMKELQQYRQGTQVFAGKHGFITFRDLFRWAERYREANSGSNTFLDHNQALANDGFMLLAERTRSEEEKSVVKKCLEKHFAKKIDPDQIYNVQSHPLFQHMQSLMEVAVHQPEHPLFPFRHVVWTSQMKRLFCLVARSVEVKEPVLLVGETGCGKTTVCQILAILLNRSLHIINCHQNTETSDFLGGLRPVRNHTTSEDDDQAINQPRKIFEWCDGPLITSMLHGDMFLIDEISLADDSVLERINSVLEPSRRLLLAEKGGDVVENTVAAENFRILATMNPGGDFGKKELSPALRNRFTEIWVPSVTDHDDLFNIISSSLQSPELKEYSGKILDFMAWMTHRLNGHCVTSLRDILAWTTFMNRMSPTLSSSLCYVHGASLVLLDALGTGSTSLRDLTPLLRDCTDQLVKNLLVHAQEEALTALELRQYSFQLNEDRTLWGTFPFSIRTGRAPPRNSGFALAARTTGQNAFRILRAMQVGKPILLEGSPGVGKTSLIVSLAAEAGHNVVRLNLSEQTDIMDLFGSDLPVEGSVGQFAWRDGPFLQALKNGDWVLLDELNLASQSVLEGLNACIDHRGEVFIPELNRTFQCNREGFRLFACQNPLSQGGGRKGLPKSFLNRFTQVYVSPLMKDDMLLIVCACFPNISPTLAEKMVEFNARLQDLSSTHQIHSSVGDFNLRDVFRWAELMIAHQLPNQYRPEEFVHTVYTRRLRDSIDICSLFILFQDIFQQPLVELQKHTIFTISSQILTVGHASLARQQETSTLHHSHFQGLELLPEFLGPLEAMIDAIQMKWMVNIVGPGASGKTSIVRLLALMSGHELHEFAMNSSVDTIELLGGFEQIDFCRIINSFLNDLMSLTITCLRSILSHPTTALDLDSLKQLQAIIEQHHLLKNEDFSDENAREAYLSDIQSVLATVTTTVESIFLNISADSVLNPSSLQKRLQDIQILVRESRSGAFQWVDGMLIQALIRGHWLLIDNVNFCSPSVLDRLNGLLEPGGHLVVSERGVVDGQVQIIHPHPDFRLFFTMDPKNGEISRAMRNRGIEIFLPILSINSIQRLIGHDVGRVISEKLCTFHNSVLSGLPSWSGNRVSVRELLNAGTLLRELVARGFDLNSALLSTAQQVYMRSRPLQTEYELIQELTTSLTFNAPISPSDLIYDAVWPYYLTTELLVKSSSQFNLVRDLVAYISASYRFLADSCVDASLFSVGNMYWNHEENHLTTTKEVSLPSEKLTRLMIQFFVETCHPLAARSRQRALSEFAASFQNKSISSAVQFAFVSNHLFSRNQFLSCLDLASQIVSQNSLPQQYNQQSSVWDLEVCRPNVLLNALALEPQPSALVTQYRLALIGCHLTLKIAFQNYNEQCVYVEAESTHISELSCSQISFLMSREKFDLSLIQTPALFHLFDFVFQVDRISQNILEHFLSLAEAEMILKAVSSVFHHRQSLWCLCHGITGQTSFPSYLERLQVELSFLSESLDKLLSLVSKNLHDYNGFGEEFLLDATVLRGIGQKLGTAVGIQSKSTQITLYPFNSNDIFYTHELYSSHTTFNDFVGTLDALPILRLFLSGTQQSTSNEGLLTHLKPEHPIFRLDSTRRSVLLEALAMTRIAETLEPSESSSVHHSLSLSIQGAQDGVIQAIQVKSFPSESIIIPEIEKWGTVEVFSLVEEYHILNSILSFIRFPTSGSDIAGKISNFLLYSMRHKCSRPISDFEGWQRLYWGLSAPNVNIESILQEHFMSLFVSFNHRLWMNCVGFPVMPLLGLENESAVSHTYPSGSSILSRSFVSPQIMQSISLPATTVESFPAKISQFQDLQGILLDRSSLLSTVQQECIDDWDVLVSCILQFFDTLARALSQHNLSTWSTFEIKFDSFREEVARLKSCQANLESLSILSCFCEELSSSTLALFPSYKEIWSNTFPIIVDALVAFIQGHGHVDHQSYVGMQVSRARAWVSLALLQQEFCIPSTNIDPVARQHAIAEFLQNRISDIRSEIELRSRLQDSTIGIDHSIRLHRLELEVTDLSLSLLDCSKAVSIRPQPSSFASLFARIQDCASNLCSNARVLSIMTSLTNAANTASQIDEIHEARQNEIHFQASVSSWVTSTKAEFPLYMDVVQPIFLCLSYVQHGLRILSDIVGSCQIMKETGSSPADVSLQDIATTLVQIPKQLNSNIGSSYSSFMQQFMPLISTSFSRHIIRSSRINETQYFKIYLPALVHRATTTALHANVATSLQYADFLDVLSKFGQIWKENEDLKQSKAEEEGRLFKYRDKVHNILTEEEEQETEFRSMFPDFQGDFVDLLDQAGGLNLPQQLDNSSKNNADDELELDSHLVAQVVRAHFVVCDKLFVDAFGSSALDPLSGSSYIDRNVAFSAQFEAAAHLAKVFSRYFDRTFDYQAQPALIKRIDLFLLSLDQIPNASDVEENEVNDKNIKQQVSGSYSSASSYNIYSDANFSEVQKLQTVMLAMKARLRELLHEWPEHDVLLQLLAITDRILQLSVSTPLMKIIVGLELLLGKSQRWTEGGKRFSLQTPHLDQIAELILQWRRLEVLSWNGILSHVDGLFIEAASQAWFHMHYLLHGTPWSELIPSPEAEAEYLNTIRTHVEMALCNCNLGEFVTRMNIVLAFQREFGTSSRLESSKSTKSEIECWKARYFEKVSTTLSNIHNYFALFLPLLRETLSTYRKPIEKELKEFVRLCKWNDLNYFAIMESSEKSHRALCKFRVKYRKLLQRPFQEVLTQATSKIASVTTVQSIVPSETGQFFVRADGATSSRSKMKDAEVEVSALSMIGQLHPFSLPVKSRDAFVPNPVLIPDLIWTTDDVLTWSETLRGYVSNINTRYHRLLSVSATVIRSSERVRKIAAVDAFSASILERIQDLQNIDAQVRTEINSLPPRDPDKVKTEEETEAEEEATKRRQGHIKHLKTMKRSALSSYLRDFKKIGLAYGTPQIAALATDVSTTLAHNHQVPCFNASLLDAMIVEEFTLFSKGFDNGISSRRELIEKCDLYFFRNMHVVNAMRIARRSPAKELHPLEIERGSGYVEHLFLISKQQRQVVNETLNQFSRMRLATLTMIQLASQQQTGVHPLPDQSFFIEILPILQQVFSFARQLLIEIHDLFKSGNHTVPTELSKTLTSLESVQSDINQHGSFLKFSGLPLLWCHVDKIKTIVDNLPILASQCAQLASQSPIREMPSVVSALETTSIELSNVISLFSEWEIKLANHDWNQTSLNGRFESMMEHTLTHVQLAYQRLISESSFLNKVITTNEESGSEEDEDTLDVKHLTRLDEHLRDSICSLDIPAMIQLIHTCLLELSASKGDVSVQHRLLGLISPFLQQFTSAIGHLLDQLLQFHKASSKLTYICSSVLLRLLTHGFCTPEDGNNQDGEDDAADKGDLSGTGVGQGTGSKDVSDKIENEEQVLGLQDEKQEEDDRDDIPEEENGIEMANEFEGEFYDPKDRKENDEEGSDDERELDDQMGKADNSKTEVVDEKLWGEESDDDEKDLDEIDDPTGGIGDTTSELVAKDNSDQPQDDDDKGKEKKEKKKQGKPEPQADGEEDKEGNDKEDEASEEKEKPEFSEDQFKNKQKRENETKENTDEELDVPEDLNLDGEADEADGNDDGGEDATSSNDDEQRSDKADDMSETNDNDGAEPDSNFEDVLSDNDGNQNEDGDDEQDVGDNPDAQMDNEIQQHQNEESDGMDVDNKESQDQEQGEENQQEEQQDENQDTKDDAEKILDQNTEDQMDVDDDSPKEKPNGEDTIENAEQEGGEKENEKEDLKKPDAPKEKKGKEPKSKAMVGVQEEIGEAANAQLDPTTNPDMTESSGANDDNQQSSSFSTTEDRQKRQQRSHQQQKQEKQNAEARKQMQSNPFRDLGDVLKSWRDRLQVLDVTEEASEEIAREDQQEDTAEADEFAYSKENESHDAQVLGSATKEQLEKSQNAMLDEEQTQELANLEENAEKEEKERKPFQENDNTAEIVEARPKTQSENPMQTSKEELLEDPAMESKSKKASKDREFDENDPGRRKEFDERVHTIYSQNGDEFVPESTLIETHEIEQVRTQLEEALNMQRLVAVDSQHRQELWHQFLALTSHLSQDLCEQLRLILTESQASKLQGDFRTGKRLNMRKIIPYIASQFRKDKIWLRRTKPSKREYQIAIAIDDSKSMALYHSKQLALEAMCVISGALTRLEAGSLAVMSYGEQCRLLHRFEEPFSDQSGAEILQQFTFSQERTHIGNLMENATKLLLDAKSRASRTAHELAVSQLMFVVSDLDNIYQEGQSLVEKWIRAAVDAHVFIVFVIVDSPEKRHSILEQKTVSFVGTKVRDDYYIDHFADKNYIILRDIKSLPQKLGDALRQWFEMVSAQKGE